MIRKIILLLLICSYSCSDNSKRNNNTARSSSIKPPYEYFPKEKAKVLLVGTFHMDYPNLDVVKNSESDKIDVLVEPKKSEITELVNYIKKFRPTKVGIEETADWDAGQKLKEYFMGGHRDKRSESYQLGMRIVAEMSLDTIYPINSWSMISKIFEMDSIYAKNLFKNYDYQNNDPYSIAATNWFKEDKTLPGKINLLEYFKHHNSKEVHDMGFGIYLTGDFKLDEQRGADALSVNWINRNLRILRNIQQMAEQDDRIMIIIGNGHAAILRQFIEASPEFELVEFDSL
ncbi:MAG: DUF5694 domain-containing protein [Xanthomarina gelatinilytica]|uniref:DUF5694 domain-containing protein n=1 Tax=Xanthomarina gelatinilytica TaxID=1137281 RepID=UPI003A87CD6A